MEKVREEELALIAAEASQQILFKLPDSENASVHGEGISKRRSNTAHCLEPTTILLHCLASISPPCTRSMQVTLHGAFPAHSRLPSPPPPGRVLFPFFICGATTQL